MSVFAFAFSYICMHGWKCALAEIHKYTYSLSAENAELSVIKVSSGRQVDLHV